MNRTRFRRLAGTGAVATSLTLVLAACGAANEPSATANQGSELSGTLSGAGASSQQAAMQALQAGFQEEHPDVTVNYDPIGSGGGREQFVAGAVSFAGTDAYLDEKELAAAQERCPSGQVVEVPNYISPVAIVYNLDGVDELNLAPETVARIFDGKIKKWNDPAIAADNPDADLPDTRIVPVHRSDESGTTENFVEYLSQAAPDAWPHEVSGNWPLDSGEAAPQTSGVVSAVKGGNGTIGYADASQVGDLGVAAVEVGDEFVEYSPEAASAIVDSAERVEGRSETDIALDLDRGTDAEGVYPVVLVSFLTACTGYDDPTEAELTKAFLSYAVSEEGQQVAAEAAGSAPMSDEMREQAMAAIETISATD